MILVIGDHQNIIYELINNGFKTKVLVKETNGKLNRLARQGLEIVIGSFDDDLLMTKTTHNVTNIYTEEKIPDDYGCDVIYVTQMGDFLEDQCTIQLPFILENILRKASFFPRRDENIIDINIDIDEKIPMVSMIDVSKFIVDVIKKEKKGIIKYCTHILSFRNVVEKITQLTNVHLSIKSDIFVGIPLNKDYTKRYEGMLLDDFVDNYAQEM